MSCMHSPMTRVVKVLTAAAKNRWRAARRRKEARARTGYSGPVNLPPGALDGHPGIGAAMARVHSYEWLQSAAEQPDEDGALPQPPCMHPSSRSKHPLASAAYEPPHVTPTRGIGYTDAMFSGGPLQILSRDSSLSRVPCLPAASPHLWWHGIPSPRQLHSTSSLWRIC